MFLVLLCAAMALPSALANPYGQVFTAYFSGISADTVGAGGINSLALAFFSPSAMAGTNCDFTNTATPCLKPAAGAGPSLNLGWALNLISTVKSGLSGNTSPQRGRKPIIFFSFGGLSEGGKGWDSIFSASASATQFGQNCGKLVNQATAMTNGSVIIGIDLDIEGMTTNLPHFGDFIAAFRGLASYDQFPLMMCALSGLASPDSSDYFKLGLLQKYGPGQQGVNFLNMMVNNVASSCDTMSAFWRAPALNFLPPANKMLGFWGVNLAAWILDNPGCTTGSDPLYPWMKSQGVGMAIWQWWAGDPSPITNVINQVRTG